MWMSKVCRQVSWASRGVCAVLLLAGAVGCNARIMTIHREGVINTYVGPRGSPLSIDIVTVAPSDFKGDEKSNANHDLVPGNGITSDVWFAKKPTTRNVIEDPQGATHFILDRDRIISFTDRDKPDVYGIRKDGTIRGLKFKQPGEPDSIVVDEIPAIDIHDSKAAIYVFAKFTDKQGNVKKTLPAVFSPVGAYRQRIEIEIGQEGIFRKSEPKAHGARVIKGSVR